MIQGDTREFYDEVVYFGASIDDLSDGGIADEINLLAMADQHRFGGKISFFHNKDPNCRRQHGLDPQKNYVGFFNGPLIEPKFVEMVAKVTAE